jgi:hypothetical protein
MTRQGATFAIFHEFETRIELTLLISRGVTMLLARDEVRRTQGKRIARLESRRSFTATGFESPWGRHF